MNSTLSIPSFSMNTPFTFVDPSNLCRRSNYGAKTCQNCNKIDFLIYHKSPFFLVLLLIISKQRSYHIAILMFNHLILQALFDFNIKISAIFFWEGVKKWIKSYQLLLWKAIHSVLTASPTSAKALE